MVTITTGGGGNNGVGDFVNALRAGRGDARARAEAKRREEMYQQELELGRMQIESMDAERDLGGLWGQAMGEQVELGQAKGSLPQMEGAGSAIPGPMGALMKMQAEGVGQLPEEQVTISYLMNRFPEGLELMGRLSGDSRSRFVRDVTETAAMQMESEQLQEALERVVGAGLDPAQFQGKDSGEINQFVDRVYLEEADAQTHAEEITAWIDELDGAFKAVGERLPREFRSRLNAVRNEFARTPSASYEHKLNQIESSAEIALDITQGSIRTAYRLFQSAAPGGGGAKPQGGGGSRQPQGGGAQQPQGGGGAQAQPTQAQPTQGGQPQPQPTSDAAWTPPPELVETAKTLPRADTNWREWGAEQGLDETQLEAVMEQVLREPIHEAVVERARGPEKKGPTEADELVKPEPGRLGAFIRDPGGGAKTTTGKGRYKVPKRTSKSAEAQARQEQVQGLLKEFKDSATTRGAGGGDSSALSPRQLEIISIFQSLPSWVIAAIDDPEVDALIARNRAPREGPVQGMPE